MHFKIYLLSISVLSIAACTSIFTPRVLTHVTTQPNDANAQCALHSYTATQIEGFFVNAQKVNSKNLHKSTADRGCVIKGTGLQKKEMCSWEIHAEGIGTIRCGKGIQNYVCLTCLGKE